MVPRGSKDLVPATFSWELCSRAAVVQASRRNHQSPNVGWAKLEDSPTNSSFFIYLSNHKTPCLVKGLYNNDHNYLYFKTKSIFAFYTYLYFKSFQ